MIKDIIQQNNNTAPNSKQLTVLKEHFPACFKSDGSFDIERFKAEIASASNVVQEGYELKFLGKSYAKLLASTDTTTVIQPNETNNNLPENAKSENIYISGDNLDGLKHLLKSYNGEINCIYIDPPYNTGSDGFVYFDNFNYNKDTLQEKLSVSEEEAVRILDLTKRGSASHSAWLMFMYCRLLLAKDLLTDDGVIFISIDDNENANLKLICDDVFGEENLINNVVINMNSLSGVKMTHAIKGKGYPAQKEYLLIYKQGTKTPLLKIEKKSKEEWDKEYTLIIPELDKEQFIGFENSTEQDVNAVLRSMRLISLVEYANEINIELTEDWKWENSYRIFGSKSNTSLVEKIKDKVFEQQVVCYTNSENNLRFFRSDYNKNTKDPRIELVNADANSAVFLSDNWVDISNDGGVAQEGGVIFPNGKKPLQLITRILRSIDHSNNTILDFFSGSATTAHAVMLLNAEYGGNRKFIAIQLPEVLSASVDSQKVSFNFLTECNLPTTLDYIGIERIKRSAAKIKQEHPDKVLDLGFKHYVLSEPNQNTLDKLDRFDKAGLLADTSILDDFGKPTILATWLNADGYGLAVNAENIDLAGYSAYYCQKHLYLIDPSFTLESMKALLSKYDTEGHFNPENLVLFGYSFPDWSINEMIEKNLRILNDGEKNLKINFTVRY